MSSIDEQAKNKFIVPKAPKPKVNIIPKTISYINLIEVDDDEDSDSSQIGSISISSKKIEKCQENSFLSDDRYEDSFDEEFGDGCETNPDSGNMKLWEHWMFIDNIFA